MMCCSGKHMPSGSTLYYSVLVKNHVNNSSSSVRAYARKRRPLKSRNAPVALQPCCTSSLCVICIQIGNFISCHRRPTFVRHCPPDTTRLHWRSGLYTLGNELLGDVIASEQITDCMRFPPSSLNVFVSLVISGSSIMYTARRFNNCSNNININIHIAAISL